MWVQYNMKKEERIYIYTHTYDNEEALNSGQGYGYERGHISDLLSSLTML